LERNLAEQLTGEEGPVDRFRLDGREPLPVNGKPIEHLSQQGLPCSSVAPGCSPSIRKSSGSRSDRSRLGNRASAAGRSTSFKCRSMAARSYRYSPSVRSPHLCCLRRSSSARRSRWPGTINDCIQCGGVLVRPGDAVVGDDDGVVVVARSMVDEVIQIAHQSEEVEGVIKAQLEVERCSPGKYYPFNENTWKLYEAKTGKKRLF